MHHTQTVDDEITFVRTPKYGLRPRINLLLIMKVAGVLR